jgi:hypothetical protein
LVVDHEDAGNGGGQLVQALHLARVQRDHGDGGGALNQPFRPTAGGDDELFDGGRGVLGGRGGGARPQGERAEQARHGLSLRRS